MYGHGQVLNAMTGDTRPPKGAIVRHPVYGLGEVIGPDQYWDRQRICYVLFPSQQGSWSQVDCKELTVVIDAATAAEGSRAGAPGTRVPGQAGSPVRRPQIRSGRNR